MFGVIRLPTTKTLIIAYTKRTWPRYVFGLLTVIAATYFTAQVPRLLGVAIDYIQEARPPSEIVATAGHIAVAAFLAFALRFFWRFLILGYTRGVETYIRAQVFKHLETLSADFYIKYNTGDIITRTISDLFFIRRMFGFSFVASLDAATIFLVVGINMFAQAGFAMSFAAILPIPFLIMFIIIIRKHLRARQYEIREAASGLASKAQENLTGIRVIKAYSQEESEKDNFKSLSLVRWAKEMRLVRLSASISPIIQIAFAVTFSIFIIFGSRMVADGQMTVGDFTAFNGYILLMAIPISNIGRVVDVWQTGLSSFQRLDEILIYKPSVTDDYAEEGTDVTEGRIELKNLTFAYPQCDPVLNNLSFTVHAGETIAVTGAVGCGKTTLASILLRQWKIRQGMIAIDGNDINSISVKKLRDAIGYVPQDNFLFSETIMDNIRFYDTEISDEDVYAAAKAVSIHDNIMGFALQYDTVVGERGMTLSGGQKQRISIARALVRKPKILILDDCLSAVDAETEHNIIKGLKSYTEGVTGIIITNRVAAASLADRILVLNENGSMAEMGTYDELMEAQGEFYKLSALQTGADLTENT